MEVVLSAPRGFCAGVVRAVEIVELCLERLGAPIYVRREIVHNPHVVKGLQAKGAVFVEETDDAPDGATIIFSAHGVAPSVWQRGRERNLKIIDATCPLVTKVHIEAIRYAKAGYSIILVGHRGHDEVIGTMGEAPDETTLVGTVEEAREITVANPERVVALTQTTLSVTDTATIIAKLRERFPKIITRNDICYATTNRQDAVKALATQVDIVLVIGAQNSSNCARLSEVAAEHGVPSHLINGPDEIQSKWMQGVQRVGVTSGASTPEALVESVIEALSPTQVTTVSVTEENVMFSLPQELQVPGRKMAGQRSS